MKKLIALILAALMSCAALTGCSSPKTDFKIALVTDSGSISDNHLNQAVWEGLELIEEEYHADINFYRPENASNEELELGASTLIENGYNIIVYPGAVCSEAFAAAAEAHPDVFFIGVDCTAESIPENAAVITFDKGQAGFLAGLASALEKPEGTFGGVLGSQAPCLEELVSGFIQGVNYAAEVYDSQATAEQENFLFAEDMKNYPLGQSMAAELFDGRNVDTLLVSSDPTGYGAAAEGRVRAAFEDIKIVGSDADYYTTAIYNADDKLSCAVTSAFCDYAGASADIIRAIIEGQPDILGKNHVYDLSTSSVGLPEENPNLSEDTIAKCDEAKEKLISGEITVVAEVR